MPPKAASVRKVAIAEANRPTPSVGNKRPAPTSSSRYVFSYGAAFRIFALFNVAAALLSPIQDCDETFNYWEPAHYLLHGYGRQTWEYSPEYAIRDWTYIMLHAVTAGLGGLILRLIPVPGALRLSLGDNVHEIFYGGKVAEFYALRIALGLMAAACQARFATAISRTLNPRVAILTGLIMIASPGFFHASPAFLPSSFAMAMNMLGASAFMDWKMGMGGGAMSHGSNAGIMWFGAGAILGWPFAGALVVPFLLEELVVAIIAEDKVELLRRWADGAVRATIILSLQFGLNVFFYHKAVFVPFNIVMYNIFPGEGRGPDIYGTEPTDFYLKNLALNFNFWLVLSLASAPILVLRWFGSNQGQSKYILMRSLFFVMPFYMWLGIFSAQAHKEERFMYPAYPFLALNAAISLHSILAFIGNPDPKSIVGRIPPRLKFLVVSIAVIGAVDLGAFRIAGMVTGYRAPMKIYGALQKTGMANGATAADEVCLGKEWYRFPASFFLPNGAHAKFIRSEFNGLLPGEFSEAGTGFGFFPGTWLTPPGMNDINEFDPGKVVDIRRCTYLVDSYRPGDNGTALEPNFASRAEWEEVQCVKFMDAANTSGLARLLWLPDVPFVPEKHRRRWTEFCLLRRKLT